MKRKNKFWSNVFLLMLIYTIGLIFSLCIINLFKLFNFISNAQLQALIASVISVIVVFSLLYGSIWGMGEHDCNMVAYGHLKENLWRGALLGVFTLVIPFFAMLYYLFYTQTELATLILRFLFMPLSGMLPYLQNHVIYWVYAAFLVCCVAACCAGYFCGYKGISFMNKVWYKKKP